MMTQLKEIHPNPFRDFELDPLDPERVNLLAESIGPPDSVDPADLGFWGGLCIRAKDGTGPEWELAFGHHRLAALRQKGWHTADINVVKYDDLQMAKAMAMENSTQRQGMAANTDAVAAAVRAVGTALLGSRLDLGKIFPRYNENPKAIETAKGQLLQGNGLGTGVLTEFFGGTISMGDIRAALSLLKKSGKMATLLDEIQKKLALDSAPEETQSDAAKAALAVHSQPRTLHPALATVIPNASSLSKVSKALEANADFIEVEEQIPLVLQAIDTLKQSGNDNPSAKDMAGAINTYGSNMGRWVLSERTPEMKDADAANTAYKSIVAGLRQLNKGLNVLGPQVEEGRCPLNDATLMELSQNEIEPIIQRLEQFVGGTKKESPFKLVSTQ